MSIKSDVEDAVRDVIKTALAPVVETTNFIHGDVLDLGRPVGDVLTKATQIEKDVTKLVTEGTSDALQLAKNAEKDVISLFKSGPDLGKSATSLKNLIAGGHVSFSVADGTEPFATRLSTFLGNLKAALIPVFNKLNMDRAPLDILSDAQALIDNVEADLLEPLSTIEKYVDFDEKGDLFTKIDHVIKAIPSADGTVTTKEDLIGLLVVANVLRFVALVFDAVATVFPLNVKVGGEGGGAVGAFASITGAIDAISLSNLICNPVSALLNFVAGLLSDLGTVVTD